MKGVPILFISGDVEILANRKKTLKPFTGVVVLGATDEEIRANFDYSRAFADKSEKKQARDLQSEGKVRLARYTVNKNLGLTTY